MMNIDPARAARINAAVRGPRTARNIMRAARAAEMTVEEVMYVFGCSRRMAQFAIGQR